MTGGTITLELKFINAGQTPACEFYALAQTGVFKKDVTPPPIEPPDETLADKSVVGPGRTRCYVKIIEASRNDIKLIKDGKKYGFLWGEARYQDIFGKRRYLTFIYRTGFDVRGNWILQPTKGGEKTN